MDLQDSTKGKKFQGSRRFHRTPFNILEVDVQISNIPMEKISRFFGNISKYAEQHFFNLKITCDAFILIQNNVTGQLFLQTLSGDTIEWYGSLLPNSITNWDVL
jgi:hypothetical protein